MSESLPEVHLVRHGETVWTLAARFTGRAEIPLTERGERDAARLADVLRGIEFTRAFTSPLGRARRTCELAGFGAVAAVDPDLSEWDYGTYEGRTREQIREGKPDWSLFRDGCPGGESVEAVGARADRVIARLRSGGGRILLFGHGHFSRVMAARWLAQPAGNGACFELFPCARCILSFEHDLEAPTIRLWNHPLEGPDSRPVVPRS